MLVTTEPQVKSAGMTPNMVTAIGTVLCIAAFILFIHGWYWTGVAAGFGFMVLDTVDGKLARCTGQSSFWGNIFDHGLDLVHPPFWWWAWAEGLEAYGRPFERVYELLIVGAIVFGYVAQRAIEGIFVRRYGMHIHVWRRIDSRFRLITARRNPNMVILFASLLIARPDLGIQLVALWTMLSLIFHAVRLAQANARRVEVEAQASASVFRLHDSHPVAHRSGGVIEHGPHTKSSGRAKSIQRLPWHGMNEIALFQVRARPSIKAPILPDEQGARTGPEFFRHKL